MMIGELEQWIILIISFGLALIGMSMTGHACALLSDSDNADEAQSYFLYLIRAVLTCILGASFFFLYMHLKFGV